MISVVMIVRDGAATLEKALKSLSRFDDVVVYDNGSTDGSQEIAKRFANVRLIDGYFDGFGPTKNRAATLANHDWVLILDSDEALEPELVDALLSSHLDESTVYLLNFKAFYRDQQVKYCGWNDQKIRRLYNRRVTGFTPAHVHENIQVEGLRVQELQGGSVLHFSYLSMSDFIEKVDRYSTLYAQSNKGRKASSPAKAVLSGLYSFFRTYVLKKGFLDGHVGLLIGFSHMATNFYKYMKLYEANRDLRLVRK
jgi:glycosyltransferase involved in cell wall biosynthesis